MESRARVCLFLFSYVAVPGLSRSNTRVNHKYLNYKASGAYYSQGNLATFVNLANVSITGPVLETSEIGKLVVSAAKGW